MTKYWAAAIGLTIANFLMQILLDDPTWHIALDRCWWELTAIGTVAILDSLDL